MHFAIQKDVLAKTLRAVTSVVPARVVQPILSNILVESLDESTLRFTATDLDLTIQEKSTAVVYTPGTVTLPGKKLLEIVSKLPNDLVSIQVDSETYEAAITCKRSKFSMTGLPAEDYPKLPGPTTTGGMLLPAETLKRSISQTSFASAGFDTSNILGGVYFLLEEGNFEATATDGNRLAHRRDVLRIAAPATVKEDADREREAKASTATIDKPVSFKAIVPARACAELLKLVEGRDAAPVRVAVASGQITFEWEQAFLSARLIAGEYPRYQELFPTECKYMATINREEMVSAIERVAVMADERTNLVKMHFEGENLQISANTPDVGRAQEEMAVSFEGQVIDLAMNVRYVLDVLQHLSSKEVLLEMTGPLKPLIFRGADDENYKYLLMPVQAR